MVYPNTFAYYFSLYFPALPPLFIKTLSFIRDIRVVNFRVFYLAFQSNAFLNKRFYLSLLIDINDSYDGLSYVFANEPALINENSDTDTRVWNKDLKKI